MAACTASRRLQLENCVTLRTARSMVSTLPASLPCAVAAAVVHLHLDTIPGGRRPSGIPVALDRVGDQHRAVAALRPQEQVDNLRLDVQSVDDDVGGERVVVRMRPARRDRDARAVAWR